MGILPMSPCATFNFHRTCTRRTHTGGTPVPLLLQLNPLHIETQQAPVFADAQGSRRSGVG
jgi:hypothetical protein